MSYLMNIKQQNRLTLLMVLVENRLPVKASSSSCWQFRGIQSVHKSFRFAIYWYRLVPIENVKFGRRGWRKYICLHTRPSPHARTHMLILNDVGIK